MFGLVLIGMIAGHFGMLVRVDLAHSRNLQLTAQADATIEATALRVAHGFLTERGQGFWQAGGAVYAWQENAFDIRMTVETDKGAGQTTSQNLSASLLIELIMAHGRSADEAKNIANDILTVSQIPSSPVQVNNASSSANIDSENKNKSRRAQLLSIDGMDDDLVNSLIHIIPSSPTSSGPIGHSRQNEETLQPSFDGKRSATASETQNGIIRLTDSNTTQKSPLSAVQMKIRLQQSGKTLRDVNVRIVLTGPKEAPVQIIWM
ncbi:hypothetical protein [Thalassospira sp.]|uniref:hypothetical protein n=1 Tax=Thalassospira sp. TaxID=1912094 RepID=UPI0032EACA69